MSKKIAVPMLGALSGEAIMGAFVAFAPFGPAFAQAPVQQVPTRLDAGFGVATAVGAVNTQQIATITVPGGQYAYITGISIEECTNATGTVQSNVSFTSTNITGSPQWSYSQAATANVCQRWNENYATPLKSAAPGTNVAITSPSSATNNSYGIRMYYYLAP